MTFLDFEHKLADIQQRIDQIKAMGRQKQMDVKDALIGLEREFREQQTKLYQRLTRWQKVQLARHPQRPYTLFYIQELCDKFVELHGDRHFGDDKAIVGGLGSMDGQSIMFIGHQKGHDTKSRQYRNFGMPNPEGYRKALRLMKLAEKFNKPIVCFIDTPGAYPGIEAEERGQAAAVAQNLLVMTQLKVPIICMVIGEGASGGALGIGVGDRILMLENTWYSVISPESCSSILWRSWQFKERAAEQLKLTAQDMKSFGIADEIVPEPLGGAHRNPKQTAKSVKEAIKRHLRTLLEMDVDRRVVARIDKFTAIGEFEVIDNGA